MTFMQRASSAALLFAVISTSALAQQERIRTQTHEFLKMADGLYLALGTGTIHVMSNSMVLVGDTDVLIVDSHVTAAAARALVDSVKTLSDKPIRYLVNSHYHFDHAHGNQVFPRGVEIIGHEYTREKLSGNPLEEATYRSFASAVPDTIADLKKRIAGETDANRKTALQARLEVQEAYLKAMDEVVPTPPNVTMKSDMTLYQGDREIQLHHFGRGHTGGDVVVFLPKERIVFTGDLMLPGLSYMGDGWVNEWPDTLEALKGLDFDVMLPGHGPPMEGKAPIDNFQALLRDLWKFTRALRAEGLSAEQAAEMLNLSRHKANYPQLTGLGFDVRAVRRMYQVMSE